VVGALQGRLPPSALDREICEKALLLVAGGGGGVGWSYLGALALLEQYGLVPRLLAGTSMGAVLLLFRARRLDWSAEDVAEAMRGLSFRTLFRFLHGESRYGLPAAMRLYLRAAIGDFLKGPDGHPLTLSQLAIPLVVSVTGIRNGALPRDPSYYEHLLDSLEEPRPNVLSRMVSEIFQAIGELIVQRDRFARIYLGADEETREFDAIDAVGFSSALPGVIHYDVVRDDERMHALLGALLARHDLFRLVDGGLVDNLPARAAWAVAQRGDLGTRNAFVLALEGFAPKLSQPLWFGLEQLAAQNVARNRPFVHHHKSFQRVLSPLEVVPEDEELQRAIRAAKSELHPDMPFIARMCRRFPAPSR
jgi:predicted acylesterase/phospholipase RssA